MDYLGYLLNITTFIIFLAFFRDEQTKEGFFIPPYKKRLGE